MALQIKVRLREHLGEIGVTPYLLGKWVEGVSPQTIYAIASGTRRPSLEVLEAILTALNIRDYTTTLEDILSVVEVSPAQAEIRSRCV